MLFGVLALLAGSTISSALARPFGTYADWWLGKATYEGVCARCHGPDGAAAHYPGIKVLAGLGKRIGRKGIRTRLPVVMLGADHYVVRSYSLKKREMDALIAYISQL